MRRNKIHPVEQYRFDGEKLVLYTKKNPIKSAICVAMVAMALVSIKPVNDYIYSPEAYSQEYGVVVKKDVVKTAFSSYIQDVNPKVDEEDAEKIATSVIKWGEHFGQDPALLLAIAKVESTFNKYAISPVGAMGILQVLPRWHIDKLKDAEKTLGSPEMFKIDPNVYVGAQVIRDCKKKFGSVETALKCYNGSVGMDTSYASSVLKAKYAIETKIKETRI